MYQNALKANQFFLTNFNYSDIESSFSLSVVDDALSAQVFGLNLYNTLL